MQEQGEEAETSSSPALPRDVLEHIVSNLSSARDLASVASTCKTLAEIAYLYSPQLTIRAEQQPVAGRAVLAAKRSNGKELHIKLRCPKEKDWRALDGVLTQLGRCPEVLCLTLQASRHGVFCAFLGCNAYASASGLKGRAPPLRIPRAMTGCFPASAGPTRCKCRSAQDGGCVH
jgi:hypothetical protein